MTKNLLLVDYENRHHLDLTTLDRSFSAIIFVGHQQNESKIKKQIDNKNKYVCVDYQKVSGLGKNSLDFHIAFKLGQVFETEPETHCFILSADQGFDPLLNHLNNSGLTCRRVESISELPQRTPGVKYGLNRENPELTICAHCKKTSTIEHNGGRWCTNCGRFASPPDPMLTPQLLRNEHPKETSRIFCKCCMQPMSPGDWDYDSDDLICWSCMSR